MGYSRQYYYKLCKQVVDDQDVEQQVIGLVQEKRKVLPRVGTRKVYHLIAAVLQQREIKVGRDNQKQALAVPMHHSDRGSQYCGELYVNLMKRNNCIISMTENSDPYENALAERMNRTIKEEFGLDGVVKSKDLVYKMVKEAIELYNYYRPHLSLNMKTPHQVYKKSRPLSAVGT